MRSERSMIQTIGRAARNANGRVIMYADVVTGSMKRAIDETKRRRDIQIKYNEEHHITPQTINKSVRDVIEATKTVGKPTEEALLDISEMDEKQLNTYLKQLEKAMKDAAKALEFERAAQLRDEIQRIQNS